VLGYCDVDGESLGSEPNWSVSLNSEYSVPFENTAWYLRGLYKFTGERDNSSGAAGIGAVVDTFDSYQVFNLYTGLRSQDASWDVSLWVKNLFDEEVVLIQNGPDQFDVAASGGSYTQINVLALRSLGMTGRYSF
jgi:outer membrane receptor protein involved in Fe transport